jgi:hypothetical protein
MKILDNTIRNEHDKLYKFMPFVMSNYKLYKFMRKQTHEKMLILKFWKGDTFNNAIESSIATNLRNRTT